MDLKFNSCSYIAWENNKFFSFFYLFCSKYIAISNGPQRAKYKQDFNAEYQEYRDLHDNVEKVTKKFAELETLMRQAQPGTEEYEVGTQRLKYLRENVHILQSVLTVINILYSYQNYLWYKCSEIFILRFKLILELLIP